MDELVKWLGDQLDEDERVARAASLGPWVQSGIGDYGWTVTFGGPGPGAGVETADSEQGLADADFIAAHDPARVLREIEAKREALAHYERIRQHTRQGDEAYVLAEGAVSKQIQIMATAYADRPGYRKEWRPS
jgi:hypothetical protein